jgi:hypothetical protein
LALSLAAGVLANCGTPASGGGGGGNQDAGGGSDVVTSNMDGGTTGDGGGGGSDARADVRSDAATDRPAPRDNGPVITNPCATDAQVDITTRMPDMMGVVSYQGNNNRAPETGGLPTPAMCLAGMNMP